MFESARELDHLAPIAVLPTRRQGPGERPALPVILRATAAEARGAKMRVGGLRVVDRAIRMLARLRDAQVVIADDGSIPLPRLPANIERRELHGNAEAALAALAAELGPETTIVGADTVWVQATRPDKGLRVVDGPSRAAASDVVFGDNERDAVGLIDRLINRRISSRITRYLLAPLALSPALVTLVAGFLGLYGALMIATAAGLEVALGFLVLQTSVILDGCAGELARVRLHQTAFGAWLDTIVGDFVNVVLVLAMGLSLWRHGGTFLDMKIALVAAGATLVYMAISYRELMRQREGDVLRLRWWFAYGQTLRGMSGAGSRSIKAVLLLGRRDLVVFLGIALAFVEQLPAVLLYSLIVAIVRGGAAFGQLVTPDWRIRPQI